MKLHKDLSKSLNVGDESFVAPQSQKYEVTLKPIPKITKIYKNDNKLAEKMIKRREYANDYYQKNKEKKKEYTRNYHQNNKEKLKEKRNSENFKQIRKKHDRDYYYKNREKILENKRIYNQNNKEKGRESSRKYREKKKNEKENLKNEISILGSIQSEINKGTSFVLPQNNDSPKASDNLTKILNDGAESSVAPQNQEYKETLNTTSKNETKIDEENINSELINAQSNEGNLLTNTQNNECESKEKDPIVSKENIQLEKGEDVEVNDNAEEGEDTPFQTSHNKEGIGNAEGTSFINPQNDVFVNNLSYTNAFPSGQPNVQSSVGLHTQQMDDHDDLIDLSLLDDSYFLDYLNSFPNS
uniref:Uncharacterized protein n=1 Tax=Meloidogyne enterolobii TaxID=390850 RepID=A0A6V7VAK0_MELEN|nr:unnamed protein product [Meloidogyne enterolobii]